MHQELGIQVGEYAVINGTLGALASFAGTFIGGLMIAGAASLFPKVLHSTIAPEYSMSAYKVDAAGHGLSIALVWWPVAMAFSIGYFFFIYRHYSGKATLAQDTQIPY